MNDHISGQTDVTGATLQGHQDAPPLDPGMVCMSVVEDGPRIAFAAYNEDLNCIIVEYAVVDGYETQDIVERVLSVIRPTLILISNKIVANDNLLELLTTPPIQLAQGTKNAKDPLDTNEAAHGLSQSIDDSGLAQPSPTRRRSIPYRMMKTASFDIRNSKTIITQKLRVRSLMRQLYKDLGRGVAGQQANRHFPLTVDQPQNRSLGVSAYHALASIIDFDSNVQVQALGSLLSFLHTTVFRLEQGGFITVNDLVPAKASLYMTISPTTLSTLHIFNTEHHPLAAAKGASNSKEGFSLFSLLDRTKSRTGRQRLRDWMLKPLLDVDAIRLRQDGVELFMQEDLQVAVGSILNLLGKVGAVDKILVRIQKCCAKPNDFLVLTRSLAAGIAICGNLQQDILWNLQRISVGHTTDDETAPCINEPPSIEEARVETAVLRYLNFVASILRNCHIDIIHEIHERITSIVDEELTSECQSVVIRVGFHERLDIYKRQYDGLDEIMKDVATALGDQYPLLRDVLKVMFMPQVGFLVALPPSPQWMENGALPDDFEYVFSESLSYFKSAEMRQLDQNIGDLDAFIKDAETLIVAELEDEILDHESELRETFIALAELDCILSFAGAAADLDFVRPRVVSASEQCVEISRGRHPLQEIVLDTAFVPNDTTMNTTSRVTVITGPNFSGKSCFARQGQFLSEGLIAIAKKNSRRCLTILFLVPCKSEYSSIWHTLAVFSPAMKHVFR
jgi:DNA mismatch repair ATPase MutS